MTNAIARYLNVQQAFFPGFSADGKHIVFLANITGVPQVWRVTEATDASVVHWPEQLTWGADRVMGVWPSPGTGDNRLLYTRDTGGDENAQLFLLSPDTGEEINLSAGYERSMHLFGTWSQDGSRILFAANRREPRLFDLYLQPLDGAARIVWQQDQPGFFYHQVLSPDGRSAAVVRAESSFRHTLWEIDLDTGDARERTHEGDDARYEAVWYTPDGHSLLVNTDVGSDFLYVARLDLETSTLEPIVQADWDIEQLALSPDGRSIAYVVNEESGSKLVVRDLEGASERSAPSLSEAPGVVALMDHLQFAPDSGRLAFSFTSTTRTSDIYVWGLETDEAFVCTRSAHGGLPPATFVAPRLIHYPTFDDRAIPAWFYSPGQDDGRRPAVILVHGGPEGQSQPFFHFLVQYLVHNGFVVLAPNVRGSTGYGKEYSHLDDVEKRMDSVADLAHAAHWLRKQSGVDANRLAVYGGSYGGFMVLAALTSYPELWAAGVDIVGISSLVTFLQNTSGYRRAHREAEYGSLEHDREFLERIAPINQVDKIVAPLMVIHGANDPRVPLGEAEQLVNSLRARDVPVEFLVFDDEGHGIVKLANKLVAFPRIVEFLTKHL